MKKLLTVVVLLFLTTGLIFGGGAKPAKAEKILVYGTTDRVIDMDPANSYDFHTWEIFRNVYAELLKYEPGTGNLQPALAESYTVNETADVYTFKLRKDIKFSDGRPVTAHDVKWSVDRTIRLEGDPSWLVTEFVESVDAVDDYTVRFNLKGPVGFFPYVLNNCPYMTIDKNIYPENEIVRDIEELKGGELIGLGPYKITSFKRDEEMILEKNPYYYGQEANIDKIVIRYFADATTMRLAFEKGELDLVYKTLNPSDIADLEKNPNYNTFKMPGPYIRYVTFECSESIFKDKILRQAIGHLVNRPEICQKVFLNQVEPLYSMVPMGMIWHEDNFKEFGDGNVEKANALLAQRGYTASNPLVVDLWYTTAHYGSTEADVAAVLEAQFEKANIEITLKSAEWATYRDNWKNKVMPLKLMGWYPDYIDPDNYTAAFAGTAGSAGSGIYFSDPEWDALFTKEQQSTDQKEREAIFRQIQKMWLDECPGVPMFQGNLYVFTKKNIGGVKIGPPLIFNYEVLTME
jgi:peptide/nickel transport system substrate-binding protein